VIREPLYESETLRVRVTVRAKASDGTIGAPINLTGATMTAAIGIPDQPGTAGTVVPVDLVNGVVDVAFPATGNVASSYVVAQLRVPNKTVVGSSSRF